MYEKRRAVGAPFVIYSRGKVTAQGDRLSHLGCGSWTRRIRNATTPADTNSSVTSVMVRIFMHEPSAAFYVSWYLATTQEMMSLQVVETPSATTDTAARASGSENQRSTT